MLTLHRSDASVDDRSGAASAALYDLHSAALILARLEPTVPASRLYHHSVAALHGVMAAASAAETAGASQDDMREATFEARAFCARYSRTFAHAQTWPRGYPGDYQIIERLLDSRADGEPGTLEHAFESAVLRLPIVVQHRAKVSWQADLVRRGLARNPQLKVLSIGCGGSRDLMLLDASELSGLAVVLSDLDDEALELSTDRLRPLVRSLDCVPGNVLRRARQLRDAGPFDVVLVGGLLDYLPDRAAHVVLGRAFDMLAVGGVLGCTNIAAENVWRLMLELLSNWPLIDRSEEDLARLFSFSSNSIHLTLDHTRLTWLVTASAAQG